MKAKKIILSSLAAASASALALGAYKNCKDQKRLRTQEELVAEVREQMENMGKIGDPLWWNSMNQTKSVW